MMAPKDGDPYTREEIETAYQVAETVYQQDPSPERYRIRSEWLMLLEAFPVLETLAGRETSI